MAISCLGFNTIALFSRQIFKIDDAPVNASLLFWFCFAEMICSVPWKSPMGDYQNIWLTGEHSEPIGTIRTLAYGPTQKSPPSVQAVFQVVSAPVSSQFLCPRPPLLLSAPNQNRHATQANIKFDTTLVFNNSMLYKNWQLQSEPLPFIHSTFFTSESFDPPGFSFCSLS